MSSAIMKPDFDFLEEFKRHRWPLSGMSAAIFIVTLLIFSGGDEAERLISRDDSDSQVDRDHILPKNGGLLIDTSEQIFETDQFRRSGPVRFFIRGAGTNRIQFQRKTYDIDESVLDPRAFPGIEFVRYHKGSSTNREKPIQTNGGIR